MPATKLLLDPVLINTVGHSAGILLFSLFLWLMGRDWENFGVRRTWLSMLAAALALTWNLCALTVLAASELTSNAFLVVTTIGFAALSMLPAVLLQVVLRARRPLMVLAGYVVSAAATALHLGELTAPPLHDYALVTIAAGYAAVIAFAIWREGRNTTALLLLALLVFTTSFLHFGVNHPSRLWPAEVTWHHAGIPVVLILLLQDYRFLLLDAFLRFVLNAVLGVSYVVVMLASMPRWNSLQPQPFALGLYVVAGCVSLILFAYARNRLQDLLTRRLFLRRDVDSCIGEIGEAASKAETEAALLDSSAKVLGRYLGTEWTAIVSDVSLCEFRPEVELPLRLSSGDLYYLRAGSRPGGRRYLSEELEDIKRLGAAIVAQIERFRAAEWKRLVAEAELRALQAQINPHFLFNALNTLYGTIDRQSHAARSLVLNLAEVFRFLLGTQRPLIRLSEELRIIRAYLEIESLRLGDRLQTEIAVSDAALTMLIPVLSIQPLVENAVKHGIAAKEGGGRVRLCVDHTAGGLEVSVEDSGPGFDQPAERRSSGSGTGLENVRRRLALYFGPASELHVNTGPEGTVVRFFLPKRVEPQAA